MKYIHPKKLLAHTLVALLYIATASTSNAYAQSEDLEEKPDTWYQIELIIFEYTNSSNAETEIWPQQPDIPDNELAIELIDRNTMLEPASMPKAFQLLDQNEFLLSKEFRLISNSRQRKPILHIAWRQPAGAKDESIPVKIHGGKLYNNQSDRSDNSTISESGYSESNKIVTFPGNMTGQETTTLYEENTAISPGKMEQITGTIILSRARYLHIWADFIFRKPAEDLYSYPANAAPLNLYNQQVVNFRLLEHRRMRSNEIHYLDHPLFGIIVVAMPYELPEPTAIKPSVDEEQLAEEPQVPENVINEKTPETLQEKMQETTQDAIQ